MLYKINRILRTVRYLKFRQICYQVRNRVVKSRTLNAYIQKSNINFPVPLNLLPVNILRNTADKSQNFTFLNLKKTFDKEIDWNFQEFGKLWNYNLQYAGYLNEEAIEEKVRAEWIQKLYEALCEGRLKLEPYPVSLRCMNVIRFFSNNHNRLKKYPLLLKGLGGELRYLHQNYEFHLLGNHLLENAFALLMGGFFFQEEKWIVKAQKILYRELDEQILDDGAHFELSPMYHQIILFRILEAISYLEESRFKLFLAKKASKMLGWMNQVSFSNGDVPQFNDSTDGVSFTRAQLLDMAEKLQIKPAYKTLNTSGYRKIKGNKFELIADVYGVSPSYQPGHNHADHGSFVLYVKNKPFIVDPGISTYNISGRRQWERSSEAHNTVTINNQDQSEVWGGFRVGRRAAVRLIKDTPQQIILSIKYRGTIDRKFHEHVRHFNIFEDMLCIKDTISSQKPAVCRFYLHPEISIIESNFSSVKFNNGILMKFKNIEGVDIKEYQFCEGYNMLVPSKVLVVNFTRTCESAICLI